MAKILNIVESAYRATLEEQDDTVLWLTHMLKNSGAEISILLKGNAVNYLSKGQDASGLAFGSLELKHPPELDRDLTKMMDRGIAIFAVEEDVTERGLSSADLVAGVTTVSRHALPQLFDQNEMVWHW